LNKTTDNTLLHSSLRYGWCKIGKKQENALKTTMKN